MKRKLEVVIDDETYAKLSIPGVAVTVRDAKGTELYDDMFAKFCNQSDVTHAADKFDLSSSSVVAILVGMQVIEFLDPGSLNPDIGDFE